MPDSVRPVIVIPGDDPAQVAGSAHLDRLREHGEVTLYDTRPADDDEKIQRAKHADVMINSRGAVKWPADVLAALPKLKMIALCGIGTDSVDLEAAHRQGIVVANIPGKTAPVVGQIKFQPSRLVRFHQVSVTLWPDESTGVDGPLVRTTANLDRCLRHRLPIRTNDVKLKSSGRTPGVFRISRRCSVIVALQ